MVKNVLTIDIDFISKELKKYNDKVNSELTPSQNWQVIRWVTGLKEFDKCDSSMSFILKIIRQFCKNATFLQVVEHDEVVGVLERYKTKEADLWNIDYHHDLGYAEILNELDCSNWVVHARAKKLIKKYTWVTQDDAEFPMRSPIRYNYASYKDLEDNQIPNFDLVILVTSERYTPPNLWKYNKIFYDYGISCKKEIGVFSEIPNYRMPKVDLEKYPHYLDNDKSDRVFFHEGLFVELTVTDGVPYLSFVNFGKPKNILEIGNELLEYIMNFYGTIGFCWNLKGTGAYVERLSKRYKYKKEFTKDNINYMIISNNTIRL